MQLNEELENDDQTPPVPENLAPKERIPPISVDTVVNEIEGSSAASKPPSKSGKKKRVKKAKENAKKKQEAINESIR